MKHMACKTAVVYEYPLCFPSHIIHICIHDLMSLAQGPDI